MSGRGGGVGGGFVTEFTRTLLLLLILNAAGSAALCPTPESHALSSVVLLEPGNGTRLPWSAAPEGTAARYRCDPGYLALGQTERRCRADGAWSGAAPHCHLNVASQTSLAEWPKLVDANLSTHVKLTDLAAADVDFYDVTSSETGRAQSLPTPSVREIRLITDGEHDLDGWKLFLSNPPLDGACEGRDIFPSPPEIRRLKSRRHLLNGYTHLWIHVFPIPFQACFSKILIRKAATSKRKDPKLSAAYEIQLVTDKNTGVSRHQCQLPGDVSGGLVTSWAVGERCCHLFSSRLSHSAAGQRCGNLSGHGQLLQLRDSVGLHNVTKHVLSKWRVKLSWSNEFIWTAGDRRHGKNTQSSDGQGDFNGTESTRRPGRELCHGLRQITKWGLASASCDARRMFICQTAPLQCGSPAVAAGQRYDPAPGPDLLAANVTCAGHSAAGGTVLCRDQRWTQPDFCDAGAGVLGVALGAVAGAILLLGCVLLGVASYMRHKRDDEAGWETYTYIRRLSRLSRYGGRQLGLAVNLMSDSDPVPRGAQQRPPTWLPAGRRGDAELPPPPPPASSPPSSAGLVNPEYSVPPAPPPPAAGCDLTAVELEYSVPLVQGRRHSPKLNFSDRPRDGTAADGNEYQVPYDARRQEHSRP